MGEPSAEPAALTVTLADTAAAPPGQASGHSRRQWRPAVRNSSRPHLILDGAAPDSAAPLQPLRPLPGKTVQVELNTADTLTLQLLHGIGPVYARRIVRYRERLGGFVDISQLREVYGMTDELFLHLLPHLTLQVDSIRQIPLNSAGIKELIRHPYLDPYQARDIVRHRERGHRYRSVDDLRLVATVDDTTAMRLAPYLNFE
ncbi:MAG: DNA uptake protein [bacterium P3]|nr:MAG: DNA uptake protein [bacterium P3]KWW40430.1 MAG: DNA uptake protein [bacterium F083]